VIKELGPIRMPYPKMESLSEWGRYCIQYLSRMKDHTIELPHQTPFVDIISQELVSCFNNSAELSYHFYPSLSLPIFISIVRMRGGVITAEPDLEDDWHLLFNPFKKTIVVKEYVFSVVIAFAQMAPSTCRLLPRAGALLPSQHLG
jgi:hypothetical protein